MRRGLWVTIFAGAFLCTVGVLITSAATDYESTVRELDHEADLRCSVERVFRLIIDAENAQRGYVLTGDRVFLAPLEASRARLPGVLRDLSIQLRSRGYDDEVTRLERAIAVRTELAEENVRLVAQGRGDEALAIIRSREGIRRMNLVRASVREIERDRAHDLARLGARVARARLRTLLSLGAAGIVAIALAALVLIGARHDLRTMDDMARVLEQSEERFRARAERAADSMCVNDIDGRATYANPSSAVVLGYSPDEMIALEPHAFVHPADRSAFAAAWARARDGTPEVIVHRIARKDGSTPWIETWLEPVRDDTGVVHHFHSTSRDVTNRVLAQVELRAKAEHDALTGILSRRGLLQCGGEFVRDAREHGSSVMLFFCDVDCLTAINTKLGHGQGDRAIRDAADLLRLTARDSDLVARIGGDELAVLGAVRNAQSADAFGARLKAALRTHNIIADRPYELSINTGATIAEPRDTRSLDALLSDATASMYVQRRLRRSWYGALLR